MKSVVEVQEFLEQSGVKGMKWGVRKSRTGAISPRTGKPFPRTADSTKVAELRARKPHQLSNKQLKAVNERLQMEEKFTKLNPDSIKRGIIKATAIMGTIQIGINLYNMANSPAGKAAIANGKKMLGVKPKYGQQRLF